MEAIIQARDINKYYGRFHVLRNIDFDIYPGQFVGLIGPNGAGKSTLLRALLGLTSFKGDINVLGHNPARKRHLLMNDVAFIADVATLPTWMTIKQLIQFADGVHPKFSQEKMRHYLGKTKIKESQKIKQLSKGMVTQAHLAFVMSIDVPLLILDEPTLGLDILYRKEFYAHLLEEYFDEHRSIIVTTHQAEEIEHLLTHLMFIKEGEIILNQTMEDIAETYVEVLVHPDNLDAARALNPLHERSALGHYSMIFQNQSNLNKLGEIHIPSVVNLFVAMMKENNV